MDNKSNEFRFETNLYSTISLKDRKHLEISGVYKIDSFDANEFLLETAQGWLLVKGRELLLTRLDNDDNIVIIDGVVNDLSYVDSKKGNRDSKMAKLFK